MTPNCIDACVICDINGYVGTNNNPATGQEPPGFCTNTAHHMQWIAFIAGSTNLTITVTPSNCDEGDGLEVGIYQSLNCNTFQLVSNCDGDIQEGQVGVFTNTVPLVIGQYYYFVMDGNMDDVCQYLINVTSGSTMVPPLPAAGPIQGPDTICQSVVTSYTIPTITGATAYYWTLDGAPVQADNMLDIEFNDPREYELCVYALNVCDTSAPACQTITVLPSAVSADTLSVCEGSCIEYADSTICDPGQYTFTFAGIAGCDSIIILHVEEQAFVETDLTTTICSTDSLQINGTWYYPPGMYDITLTASSGCDSIIHLDLQSMACDLAGDIVASPVLCNGDSSGTLTFQLYDGTAPFTYTWENTSTGDSGSGSIPSVLTNVTLSNLLAGLYVVRIYDAFGNDLVLSSSISEPSALEIQFTSSDFHGFGISCYGNTDGNLSAIVNGGTPGYTFDWNTSDQDDQLTNIAAGTYQLTVTDQAGCSAQSSYTLISPDPLNVDVLFTDPGCASVQSGSIEIISVSGGAPPYQYSLNNNAFVSDTLFSGLSAGLYSLTAVDANACSKDTSGTLTELIIANAVAGNDSEIDLGYSLTLSGEISPPDAIFEWSPADGLSCIHCLDPLAAPYVTTNYILTVISPDGCVATDSLVITVRKPVDDIYIPNVFSPNGDGLNDRFSVYGGRSVKWIEQLSIFSRWGELMLERKTFMPNDPLLGWDGNFRGQPVAPGVYTWVAEIRYLDNTIIRYSGDVTVVR